ncbi:MAG TPA: hypothetical protein VFG43_11080 [Geminicoccaceae bacterium]|nr:hypothetical protein [Geminicoccaceae bacterium]
MTARARPAHQAPPLRLAGEAGIGLRHPHLVELIETPPAALPMLGMVLVIQFVVGANDPAFHLVEHYYWMFLLGVIITKGPGTLSLDRLLLRRFGPPPLRAA